MVDRNLPWQIAKHIIAIGNGTTVARLPDCITTNLLIPLAIQHCIRRHRYGAKPNWTQPDRLSDHPMALAIPAAQRRALVHDRRVSRAHIHADGLHQ